MKQQQEFEELSKLIKQRTIKQKDDKCQGENFVLGVSTKLTLV